MKDIKYKDIKQGDLFRITTNDVAFINAGESTFRGGYFLCERLDFRQGKPGDFMYNLYNFSLEEVIRISIQDLTELERKQYDLMVAGYGMDLSPELLEDSGKDEDEVSEEDKVSEEDRAWAAIQAFSKGY